MALGAVALFFGDKNYLFDTLKFPPHFQLQLLTKYILSFAHGNHVTYIIFIKLIRIEFWFKAEKILRLFRSMIFFSLLKPYRTYYRDLKKLC